MYQKEIRDRIYAKKWIKQLDETGVQAPVAREYLAKGKLVPAIESLHGEYVKRHEQIHAIEMLVTKLEKEVNK